MTNRSISDLVGFALMFSIIILSVAIVTTAGITQLSELSDRESINSAERGMEALAGSADDLTRQSAIVRDATLSPSGGLVWLNASSPPAPTPSLNVTVENGTGSPYNESIVVNALEHRFSRNPTDVSITYESGAVMRSDGGGLVDRPQWHCSEQAAVATFVKLRPGDGLSNGSGFGSGTGDIRPTSGDELIQGDIESTDDGVRFQLRRQNTDVETFSGDDLALGIDPSESARSQQWEFFFQRNDDTWTPDGNYYECSGLERVVVRTVTVELSE